MIEPPSGQVLVVCTANLARSPLAAAMLDQRLGPAGIGVSSAGTRARAGLPAADGSIELGRDRGLDLTGHRSRPVTAELVRDADLVLTMSERQRDRCTALAAGVNDRVFTIREFVRLLGHEDVGTGARTGPPGLLRLREAAHAARPVAFRSEGAEDIEDPLRAPWHQWVSMADDLDELVRSIAAHVG